MKNYMRTLDFQLDFFFWCDYYQPAPPTPKWKLVDALWSIPG